MNKLLEIHAATGGKSKGGFGVFLPCWACFKQVCSVNNMVLTRCLPFGGAMGVFNCLCLFFPLFGLVIIKLL